MIKIAESDIAARKIFSEQRGRIRTGVLTGDSHETLHRNTDLRARQCAGHIVKAVFVVTPSHVASLRNVADCRCTLIVPLRASNSRL